MPYVPLNASSLLSGTPVAGEVDEIDALAAFAADVADDSMWFADDAGHARNRLDELRSGGVSAIQSKLNVHLIPGGVALQSSASETKRALNRYASEVDRIHTEACVKLREVEDALAIIRAEKAVVSDIAYWIGLPGDYSWTVGPPGVMPEPQPGIADIAGDTVQRSLRMGQLRSAHESQWSSAATRWRTALADIATAQKTWANLIDERRAAERRLINVMRDTPIGQLIRVSGDSISERRFTVAVGLSGELWGSARPTPPLENSHALLRDLIGSRNGEHVWDSPPSPETVAANWAALPTADQRRLIAEVPWVIGNLPGLPFSVRDEANRTMLEFYGQHPQSLSPDQLKLMAEVSDILKREASEIERFGEARPPVQIGALDLTGAVPKTMVGYGNLDTATHMSVQVPGMNSDAPGALDSWDIASRNLFTEQQLVEKFVGSNAVVAWLGYDTPDLPTEGDWGVLSSTAAEVGAVRLAAELDGIHAARSAGDYSVPVVNVIAHSYGTTVATIALTMTKHETDTAVFLGSAGLDTKIVPTLNVLHVSEISPGQKSIYTTHAAADRLAPVGAGLAGRGQPNAEARAPFGIQNYSPVYAGALAFPSEGDPARGLLGTDGHSVIGEGSKPGRIGMSASEGRGYGDVRTQSLNSVAKITTGQIDSSLEAALTRTESQYVELVATGNGVLTPVRKKG